MDVPEDADIGTDGPGLALLAILGTNVHLLEVGRIPNADELYAQAINQAIMERLRRIDATGGETDTGLTSGAAFAVWLDSSPFGLSPNFYAEKMQHAIRVFTIPLNTVAILGVLFVL